MHRRLYHASYLLLAVILLTACSPALASPT